MKTTTKQTKNYNGFACEITDSTDLSLGMLIAEFEDGKYEPVAVVANVGEAREMTEYDFRNRRNRPSAYKVWARGIDGDHRIACEFKGVLQSWR